MQRAIAHGRATLVEGSPTSAARSAESFSQAPRCLNPAVLISVRIGRLRWAAAADRLADGRHPVPPLLDACLRRQAVLDERGVPSFAVLRVTLYSKEMIRSCLRRILVLAVVMAVALGAIPQAAQAADTRAVMSAVATADDAWAGHCAQNEIGSSENCDVTCPSFIAVMVPTLTRLFPLTVLPASAAAGAERAASPEPYPPKIPLPV